MSRSARLLWLLLMAIWLPATLHCRLEAAGLEPAHECCAENGAQASAGDCRDDPCPTVEENLFKESSQGLTVSAPSAWDCDLDGAMMPGACASIPTVPALSPARHAPPPELEAAWQFMARAAPPARAPSRA
jgi:hypothetical protein